MAEMTKTMSEVRKVAAAIGWSAETLQRAWEAAGIAIAADTAPPWRAAYAEWMQRQKHDVIPEEHVWKAAVEWCVGQMDYTELKYYRPRPLTEARRRIMGDDA